MSADNSITLLGPLDLLVLQPTPFCNLDCSYCYLPDRNSKRKMAPAVLERIFERVFSSDLVRERFTVVWHAGEPMVLPIGFYKDALRTIAEYNGANSRDCATVTHSIQTNGVLIDREWCDFIKRNQINIGVSVDGPDFLHDAFRKTRRGAGTHRRVMNGIRLLNEHQIPFHVISVLTGDSLDYPDELYDFYVENEIHQLGFNIEEVEGPHQKSSLQAGEIFERYVRFMSRFFDLVNDGGFEIQMREFGSTIAAVLQAGRDDVPLSHETAPFGIISVDCDGNFSTFSPELLGLSSPHYGDFALGNVARDSFESAANSSKFLAMSGDIAAGIQRCQATCEYFRFCGGGAPVNKYFENGSFASTETMFCRLTRKAMVDVILEKLDRPALDAAAKS
jgi:uncharacterized protein